jgi:hypothetical protein
MSTPENPAALSDEMIDALLAQEGVRDVLVRVMQELGMDTSFEELSYETRAELLSAVVADGIIEVGPGKELSAEEFIEILEAEERAAETKEGNRNDD